VTPIIISEAAISSAYTPTLRIPSIPSKPSAE
jgi:hypothetical protein